MSTDHSYRVIRSRWVQLSIGQALLVLSVAYYMSQPAHGRSTPFKFLAAGIVGFALSVIGFTLWLRPDRFEMLRNKGHLLRRPALFAGTVVLFVLGLGSRPTWLYAFVMLATAATVALLDQTLQRPETLTGHLPKWWWGAGAVMLALVAAFRLYTLAIYPPIHAIDEPWTLGWALSYARTGHLQDLIMFDRPFAIYRFYEPMGLWLRVVGEGYWQARLFTFMLIPVVIVFSALAARNLYDRQTGFFTALALFASVILAYGARVRHDIGLGVAVAVSLWLYSEGIRRRQNAWHFFAGAAIGFGYFAHYHAAPFGVAMLFGLYAPRYVARWRQGKRLPEAGAWLYGLGGLVAAAVALTVQPLPPILGQAVATKHFTTHDVPTTVWRHIVDVARFSKYESLLILLGVGVALRRHQLADLVLVTSLLGLHLALGMAWYKEKYYLVALAPFYGILMGRLFAQGVRRRLPALEKHRQKALLVCLLFLLPNLGFMLRTPVRSAYRGEPLWRLPPPPAAAWILDNVGAGHTVVGEHPYYLWLTDYRFISPLAPNMMDPDHRAEYPTVEAVWDAIGVDVFIVDSAGTTYPLLSPLIESKYFETRGYKAVAQFGTMTIYERMRSYDTQ